MSKKQRRRDSREQAQQEYTAPVTSAGQRVLIIGAVLGVVVLGSVAYLSTQDSASDTAATDQYSAVALPPATSDTGVPINTVDAFSGKPITPASPKTTYKGYTIGFCCSESAGRWPQWPDSEKDKFVSKYLPQPGNTPTTPQ